MHLTSSRTCFEYPALDLLRLFHFTFVSLVNATLTCAEFHRLMTPWCVNNEAVIRTGCSCWTKITQNNICLTWESSKDANWSSKQSVPCQHQPSGPMSSTKLNSRELYGEIKRYHRRTSRLFLESTMTTLLFLAFSVTNSHAVSMFHVVLVCIVWSLVWSFSWQASSAVWHTCQVRNRCPCTDSSAGPVSVKLPWGLESTLFDGASDKDFPWWNSVSKGLGPLSIWKIPTGSYECQKQVVGGCLLPWLP